MIKTRVYDIAKQAGVESSTVLEYLNILGFPAKSASSLVEGEFFVAALIERLKVRNAEVSV